MRSRFWWQSILLVGAVLGLLLTLVELMQVILSPTVHGAPAKVVNISAHPYSLAVTLYSSPALAGYFLPFAIDSKTEAQKHLQYVVTAIPGPKVEAITSDGSTDPSKMTKDGVPGNVPITVQGSWTLHIVVEGSGGMEQINIPITAIAPVYIPIWLAYLIGLLPVFALLGFIGMRCRNSENR